MDLSSVRTGLGGAPGRQHVDQGLIIIGRDGNLSDTVHSSFRCLAPRDRMLFEAVPVYSDFGELKVTYRGLERAVEWCEVCPGKEDYEWHDEAACRDSGEDFFTDDTEQKDKLVAAYCDVCPVALTCLDSEPLFPGIRGIWGGVLFGSGARAKYNRLGEVVMTKRERLENRIEHQRVRIKSRLP